MGPFRVKYVIYVYLFICLTLLVYNCVYIFYARIRKTLQAKRAGRWEAELARVWGDKQALPAHRKRLRKKLGRIDQLAAYNSAMERHLGEDCIPAYLRTCYEDFQMLAVEYKTRTAMERAFFAYVLAQYHPYIGGVRPQMVNILLGYMDNATVYCRENVLHALYSIGDAVAVEHAFRFLDSRGLYHNPKLIADGLMTYQGSKKELAWRLWEKCHAWNEPLQIAVIQFASQLDADFSGAFYEQLQREDTPTELRFAYIRYFQRHVKPELKAYLIDCLAREDEDGSGAAIAACTALGSYPGADTVQALERALGSRNWYVRRNAAFSLMRIGISEQDREQIYERSDRYGREILEYAARESL